MHFGQYQGVTGRWGLPSHAQNAVRWLALSKRSVEACSGSSQTQANMSFLHSLHMRACARYVHSCSMRNGASSLPSSSPIPTFYIYASLPCIYTHPSLPYSPPTPNSIYNATFFITVLCSHISHPVLSHTHTHTHLLFTVTRAFSLPFTLGHLLDTRVHHFHTLPRN